MRAPWRTRWSCHHSERPQPAAKSPINNKISFYRLAEVFPRVASDRSRLGIMSSFTAVVVLLEKSRRHRGPLVSSVRFAAAIGSTVALGARLVVSPQSTNALGGRPWTLVKGVQGRTPAGVVNCCLVGDLWGDGGF